MASVAKVTITFGFVRLGNGGLGCLSGSVEQGKLFI